MMKDIYGISRWRHTMLRIDRKRPRRLRHYRIEDSIHPTKGDKKDERMDKALSKISAQRLT